MINLFSMSEENLLSLKWRHKISTQTDKKTHIQPTAPHPPVSRKRVLVSLNVKLVYSFKNNIFKIKTTILIF